MIAWQRAVDGLAARGVRVRLASPLQARITSIESARMHALAQYHEDVRTGHVACLAPPETWHRQEWRDAWTEAYLAEQRPRQALP